MPDVPSTLPTSLIAGTTWTFARDYGDFPQPTWQATAFFENALKAFSASAVASGSAHLFTVSAATSATYPAGRYQIRVRVTDGTQTFIAESGFCEIETDPAAAGTRDTRTWARRTLDELEALLERFATTAQQSGSVNGRSFSRTDLKALTDWRDKLRQEVKTEERGANARTGRNIKVRFNRA